ncbi:MAG: fatty acid desaturase [Bacteroidia bacterium]
METQVKSSGSFRLTSFEKFIELSRPWLLLCSFVFFALLNLWWLAIPAAVVTVLAGFVQMHDAMHNSLGLSKRVNEFVLTMSAMLLLKSGHAMRVTHLRHHGQCLGEDDPEGAPANWTLKQVFINGPYHIFTLRSSSWRISPATHRIQFIETAITFLLLLAFIFIYYFTGSVIALVYWAAGFVLSSLMPFWASYIPHHLASRSPARLAAVKLARIWTPVISSFAFHHLHHLYPKVPTVLLPKAAKELPEPGEDNHDHYHPH